jgi:hypothetical protein
MFVPSLQNGMQLFPLSARLISCLPCHFNICNHPITSALMPNNSKRTYVFDSKWKLWLLQNDFHHTTLQVTITKVFRTAILRIGLHIMSHSDTLSTSVLSLTLGILCMTHFWCVCCQKLKLCTTELHYVCLSVHLLTCNPRTTIVVFMKFNTGEFYYNLLIHLNSG